MTRTEIGAKMKELRNLAGMTIQDLADASGINKSTINQMELGKQNVSLETLITLSNTIQAEIVVKSKNIQS